MTDISPTPHNPDWTPDIPSPKLDEVLVKPIKTKAKQPKEFTAPKAPDPALDAALAFTAEIRHMTVKETRALSSLKRSPKPYVEYTEEIANTLLSLMAEGMMLVEICEREDMPNLSTVWRWRQKNSVFDAKLSRAREALGDQFAWEVRRVADDSTADNAASDRVKMDAYRWLAAKMYPKQYGDKTVTELSGTVVHEQRHVIDATMLSPENLDALEGVLRAAQALPSPESKED
jgi:hypothetical protein